MTDHSHFEELAALAAGGHLSTQECEELRKHMAHCPDCRRSEREFSDLVRSGVPLTRSNFSGFVERMRTRPPVGVRERFLDRARREGIGFSEDVERATFLRRPLVYWRMAATVAAALVLVAAFYGTHVYRQVISEGREQRAQADQLRSGNSALVARFADREQEMASQQREIARLRGQLANAAGSSDRARDSEQGVRVGQSTSQTAQLTDELQNRDKELAAATDEIARINQLRATDQASLVAQLYRINQISDQLRVAQATLEMERQLTAAGRDIRELMVARQLHVVDVRDTHADGKPSAAFGRIFLTEGKSLIFYAFDLDDEKGIDMKARFEVWGKPADQAKTAHSLGFLSVDDKAQKRWVVKVENPDLLKEINSVFLTVTRPGGESKPGEKRLLYAYLGEPNHP